MSEAPRCPCCGHAIDGSEKLSAAVAVAAAHASPQERRILFFLAKRFGSRVPTTSLIDYLYADDQNGGPENAERVLRVVNCRLRKKLRPVGLTIRGYGGRPIGSGETILDWAAA